MGEGRCEIEFGCERYPSPWANCPLAKPRDMCPLGGQSSFTWEFLIRMQKSKWERISRQVYSPEEESWRKYQESYRVFLESLRKSTEPEE